ncbi:MAG: dephospho-CoA kinase [Clostridia bacterium]|nr:dephospho-CoA kinase [Clostridia bacterium]
MITIGLTGGSGAGKGAVGKILEEFKVPCIDTDAVYRDVTSAGSPCILELKEHFGDAVVTEDGRLNRAALADIVFKPGAGDKLAELNRITHKYILRECGKMLAMYSESGYNMAVIDAPQLYESGFDSQCAHVIAVIADEEIRINRIMERDGLSREQAERRINAQNSDEYFVSRADFVIYNNGSVNALRDQVAEILSTIVDPDGKDREVYGSSYSGFNPYFM